MTARINLAPEVYQQRQLTKRRKQVAASSAILACSVAIGLVVVLLVVVGGQKVYLASARSTISNDETKLQTYPNLQAAVTIQQDLTSLSNLQSQRVHLTKFFTVLQQTDPQGVSLSQLNLNNSGNLQVQGSATSYLLTTKLAKALEASKLSNQPAFTNVGLTSAADNGQGGVAFQLTAQVSSEVTSGQ